ncbi:MAG TPA: RNA polymerase II-associated protein [Desulfurivibrio alkaliphilus]|uniref:RNA polymerase II-associated protein n=1 Tax=Desulfurivibrio alkaliphilus TaxID=427923 RepID=A0A7C2TFI4_9BACT|nr:RNA polymerase II-associated protein [Desulfurivibrio alkaliphilus]
MELLCEKYREKVREEEARCHRPLEYCKFRSACIINMLGRERDREAARAETPDKTRGKEKDA